MFRGVVAHVRRQPIAFIALFFALAGSAGATTTILFIRPSDTIPRGDLAGSTYGDPVIAPGAVTSTKLADRAVTGGKLADPTDLYEATDTQGPLIALSANRTTVLTLNVPAGKYALNATSQVINGTPNNDGFDCVLIDGNSQTDISQSSSGIQSAFDGLLATQGALTATSPDTIEMQCSDQNGGNNEYAARPSINAIRVDAINP
jgi:hypothetical protein